MSRLTFLWSLPIVAQACEGASDCSDSAQLRAREQVSVQSDCLGGKVFLSSYFNSQLEDREGAVGLNGDKGDFQKWTISDATPYGGSGRVVLTSHFGAHLEDREGTVGLHPDTGEYQWWSVQCADDGRVFLTSHRNVQLEDREGALGVNSDRGDWQMWRVLQDEPLTQCTCSDFPSAPPAPAPTPVPTPVPPAPLPPLPADHIWFGYWGNNPSDGSYDHSSLVFDNPSDEDIEQHGGTSRRFLYPAFKFFCQEQAESGSCTLFADYQARWNEAVPRMQQLLVEQKIMGFSIGDERVCGKKKKTSVDDWTAMIDAIRASFPDRGKAVIHTNECGGTFGQVSSRRRRTLAASAASSCEDAAVSKVPDGLDWISIDKYRSDSSPGFIDSIKERYESCIYPKMSSSQRAGIVPQVGYDGKHFCDDQCIAESELQDAKDSVAWATSDSRIAFIVPYAFRDVYKLGSKGDELMRYWQDFGRSTQPGTAMLQI